MRRGALTLALFFALLLAMPDAASARIVVFGDVHGASDSLTQLLQGNGIIDSEQRWIAGDTTLVSLGDLLDRGPDSRAVMDLLMRLQDEASAASGEVVVLLGNHELMNLTGELRDVSAEEFAAFASDPLPSDVTEEPDKPAGYTQLKRALSPTGHYGRWLLQQPALAVRGNTAFVHAGLSAPIERSKLEETNGQARRAIEGSTLVSSHGSSTRSTPELLGQLGPFWYRGTATCHELLETERLRGALAALEVDRLVVGHTPTPSGYPESRFDGSVITLDTGMLTKVYGGQPYLLELSQDGNDASALDKSGARAPILERSAVRIGSDDAEQALAAELADLWADLPPKFDADGRLNIKRNGLSLTAEFIPASKQQTRRAVAAWQLDRQLGFDFVPLTLTLSVDGRRGYVQISPGAWRTEAQRQLEARNVPNFCASGHVFNLVRLSDSLIRPASRSAEELAYSRRSWDVRLTGHGASFGRRTQIDITPEQAVIPPLLRTRLASLSAASVNATTQGQLSKSDVRALLARRDALLELSSFEPVSTQSTP